MCGVLFIYTGALVSLETNKQYPTQVSQVQITCTMVNTS